MVLGVFVRNEGYCFCFKIHKKIWCKIVSLCSLYKFFVICVTHASQNWFGNFLFCALKSFSSIGIIWSLKLQILIEFPFKIFWTQWLSGNEFFCSNSYLLTFYLFWSQFWWINLIKLFILLSFSNLLHWTGQSSF